MTRAPGEGTGRGHWARALGAGTGPGRRDRRSWRGGQDQAHRGRAGCRHRAGARRPDRRLRLPLRRRGHRAGLPAAARSTGCALPRMDSPSVFGAILGPARRAPSGSPRSTSRVPAARRYLPGTMILETSWGTDDRLDHRPRRAADRARGGTRATCRRTQRRTPTDYEAEHILLRTIRCVSGEVQMVVECEPVLDYGARPVRWEYTDNGLPPGRRRAAPGCDMHADPDHRHAARLRGRPGQRPHAAQGGRHPVRRAVVGQQAAAARPTTTPTRGWCGRPTTGSTGWPAAASPTTRGAATCSAAR